MSELTFEIPDEKTPGFLRRMMAANRFTQMLREGNVNAEYYENLITFLLGFITEPEDRDEAREALLDASQEQYMSLLQAINGQANPTSAPENETS
jgi:hypothetical protein